MAGLLACAKLRKDIQNTVFAAVRRLAGSKFFGGNDLLPLLQCAKRVAAP